MMSSEDLNNFSERMEIRKHYKEYINKFSSLLCEINIEEIEDVIEVLKSIFNTKNTIYTCGNGGSASTASHFVNDISLCNGKHNEKRFKVDSLCDHVSSMLAIANDESYEDIFSLQLKGILNAGDIVLGISGSGNSKNVINALNYANDVGAISIAFTAYDGGEMKKIAKYNIHVPTYDMQQAEDAHMLLIHMIMQYFKKDNK